MREVCQYRAACLVDRSRDVTILLRLLINQGTRTHWLMKTFISFSNYLRSRSFEAGKGSVCISRVWLSCTKMLDISVSQSCFLFSRRLIVFIPG